jgi:glycine dehydrogenase subunit 2
MTLTEAPMQRERATTIYEKSKTGRRAAVLPDAGVPEAPIEDLIPANLLRAEAPNLPEVAEPEIVRHYNRLSRRNFDLDSGFYPLGSCTMKHNPRLNERVAALPGHARLHPAQDPRRAQGALELMYLLQESLSEICGLPSVSLQPSAGSHGELAGLLLTRAYHADRGETRTKVLAPDTSHGTNPASVTMAGYDVVKVATNERGGVDMDDLRAKIAEDPSQIACLMLTNPNTLGLFDENIEEIAALIHEAGGTLYYDGANLNAIMGRTRPGDMGFDIVHLNLHKSFSQPHGGGGPGAGPIAVSSRIEPFLPRPQVVRKESSSNGHGPGDPSFDLDFDRPKSIGRLRGFQGNFGVLVRSYAYILSLGADGLTEASETAVLNANYLKARLAEGRAGERLPIAFDRHCMHEFVLSGRPMKSELGLATLDLAKRLLDFGFHPPTVYFPLLVDEALMVEPTETETKESLDAFADAIEEILAEAETDPEVAKNAPYSTPVRRLDEVRATRRPVVRQKFDAEGGDGGASEAAASRGPSANGSGSAVETDFNDATSPADSDA